ncbi:MAG: heme-dependent oxidative N-demethylase subunit alpha family protein [Pseudomonadota bacterium]
MRAGATLVSPEGRSAPYLPFLQGVPRFDPALKPIPLTQWLAPDTEADVWLRDKCLIMKMMRSSVVGGDLDGAAAEELLPLIMGVTGQVPNQSMPTALEEAASLVSDDLCILSAERPGDWRLQAGVLCAPTYWTLPERIGLDLGGLHGPVPGGDPDLSSRVARVFSGLKPDVVLERFNWTVQASEKRYTPDRPSVIGKGIDDLHLRVERQTIRKLARTGAIIFTIRIAVDPLLPVLRDPATREAFEDAWIGAAKPVRRYKHWAALEPLVAQACRKSARATSQPTPGR